ncbi:YdcH family protein, partial [Xenophilus sp.]
MFPEYRDLITRLKASDPHFLRLFDKHNDLDQKIKNMESFAEPSTPMQIETMKKQ